MPASRFNDAANTLPADALPIDILIVEQAIAWLVQLQSGSATSETWENCRQWRNSHPDHEQAWRQLETLSSKIKTLPHELAHATLDSSLAVPQRYSRRTILKSIALLCGTGALAAGQQWLPWQQVLADYSTAVGEQRMVTLADGTQIHLNTDTAIDIHFDDARRLIRLRQGEIFIITGHDPAERYRPFSVQSGEGNIRALGTRFLVRQQQDATLVSVFESAVEVRPSHADQAVRVETGQQLRFSAGRAGMPEAMNPDSAAWMDKTIVARNVRLADFITELDRYRPGKLRCAAEVAELKISGVFPIEDVDRVLAALERTLPIKMESYTRYWVTVSQK